MKHRTQTCCIAVGLLSLAAGCGAQRQVDTSAIASQRQLAVLREDLGRKVEAENRYMDSTLRRVSDAMVRNRSIDLEDQLTRLARTYAASAGTGSSADTARSLTVYVQGAAQAWSERDATRRELLDEIASELSSNRKQIERSEAKIARLQGTLRTLAAARSDEELARFLVGYLRSVKTEYDALKSAADAADAKAKH